MVDEGIPGLHRHPQGTRQLRSMGPSRIPSLVLSRTASPVSPLRILYFRRKRWNDSRDIPQVYEQALLAAEDANFYRHTGIDFKGVLRAAWRAALEPDEKMDDVGFRCVRDVPRR